MIIIIILGNHEEKVWQSRVKRGVEYYRSIISDRHPEDRYAIDNIRIVFSGRGRSNEAPNMKRYAVEQLNVNEDVCIVEAESMNTYENLKFTRDLLKNSMYFTNTFMTKYTFVVCTSEFHIARSTLIAEDMFGRYGTVKAIFCKDTSYDEKLYEKEKEFIFNYINTVFLPSRLA